MNLKFEVKKTNELNNDEIEKINYIFNNTFNSFISTKRTSEGFKKKFLNNFLKFSFHGLMKNGDNIVGCYHIIPYEFNYFSKRKLFGLSVDTTIDNKFRGNIYNLKKLANIVYAEIRKYNIYFVYGLPNDKFYLVKKKVFGWKDIGKLNYYVYPKNLTKIFKNSKVLNIFIINLIKILLKLRPNFEKEYNFIINKIYNTEFHSARFDESYKVIIKDDFKFIYKITKLKKYKELNVLYLIDVIPLKKKNIEIAIDEIKKIDSKIDLIVYIGCLNSSPKNLFKIPDFLLKNQRIFSGKILDSSEMNDQVYNESLWNINSSNFDVK